MALTPQRILDVGMGLWPAKDLLSAVELDVFSCLGTSSKTSEELQALLGLHPRAVPDFPDTLVALRFLGGTAASGTSTRRSPFSSARWRGRHGWDSSATAGYSPSRRPSRSTLCPWRSSGCCT